MYPVKIQPVVEFVLSAVVVQLIPNLRDACRKNVGQSALDMRSARH